MFLYTNSYGQKKYTGTTDFKSLDDIEIETNLDDGCYEAFSESGKLTFQGIIALGKPVDDVMFYYQSGELKFKLSYSITGKLNGTAVHLNKDGTIVEKRIYSMDSLIEITSYGIEGDFYKTMFLNDHVKVKWRYTHCANLIVKVTMEGDMLKNKQTFTEGRLSNESIYFSKDSILERVYSAEGNIELEGKVINGGRFGKWFMYNNKGEKIKILYYNKFGEVEREEQIKR